MPNGQIHPVIRYLRKITGSSGAGDPTDGQLLERFITLHDEEAFTQLVERHGPMVLNACRRMVHDANDADDVFQATFLVLARKARSIRQPALLANWLYGVVCRTAAKARGHIARRHSREKEMVDMPAAETACDPCWQELRPLLDDELQNLPEKYRAPLVLCYLEGRTYTEAARVLGWAEGTVSGRLARGREILKKRLTRRGLTLSTGALATVLSQNAASAMIVPATLAVSTVRAALLITAGPAVTAGVLSTQVASLTEGVLQAMFVTKLKIAAAVLLAVGVLGVGGGMFTFQTLATEPAKKEADQANDTKKQEGAKFEIAAAAPKPKDKKEKSSTKPISGKRTAHFREVLNEELTFDGINDPKATLGEFIDTMAERFELNFIVNEEAFRADNIVFGDGNISDVRNIIIGEKPLPRVKNVRFATILRMVLSRIRCDSGATFILRGDVIEITTQMAASELVAQDAGLVLFPLVNISFDNRPLEEALRELAASSDFNIILDVRAQEKAKTPMTADFTNVQVDVAVRILADMADLKSVQIENITYVTTKQNAEKLLKEQEKKDKQRKDNEDIAPPRRRSNRGGGA